MKKILSEIYTYLLLIMASITFVITWPLIFIGMFFHTLFKSEKSDSKKLEIIREITIVLVGFVIILLLSVISDRFNLL